MMHVRRFVVMVVALMALAAAPARADDFGLNGQLPDNATHTFCFDFPLERPQNAYIAFLLYWGYHGAVGPTNYFESFQPTCDLETDVIFQLTDATEYAGYTRCLRFAPDGSHCRSFVVSINPYLATGVHDMISLSCHEVGHTLGLDDGPSVNPHGWYTDCMATDFTWAETLNQHHIDHANSRRPYDDADDPGN